MIIGKSDNIDFELIHPGFKLVESDLTLSQKKLRIFDIPKEKVECFKIFVKVFVQSYFLLPDIEEIIINKEEMYVAFRNKALIVNKEFLIYQVGIMDEYKYLIDLRELDPIIHVNCGEMIRINYSMTFKDA